MVLDYFKKISAVPRGSGHNGKISGFLAEFAKSRGLRYVRDEADNVVIYKDGAGCGTCPPLILQGHMDMVCERGEGISHDFNSEGIRIIEEGGALYADGTTLGADDGIALAYMLSLLDEDMPVHPPYEMVFTSDEEVGMLGAAAFDASLLKGRHMINLDSEEEGVFTCACAGGMTGKISLPISRKPCAGTRVRVGVRNLLGGHSGMDIDKNRANAALLLGRILYEARDGYGSGIIRLESFSGGNKDNAIPNAADMGIAVCGGKTAEVADFIKEKTQELSSELSSAEPDMEFFVSYDAEGGEDAINASDEESLDRILALLSLVPNGIRAMSADISGMVESSTNLGICGMEEEAFKMSVLMRSQKESYMRYMDGQMSLLARVTGAVYETCAEYPGWDIRKGSPFRDMLCEVYEGMAGKKPDVCSVHAGLEGGIFAKKIPGIDIVSIGPDIKDAHTVNERLDIGSARRVYEFLKTAAREFAKSDWGNESGK